MKSLIVPVALLLISTAANADQRLRDVDYDPDEIVRIVGRPEIQSTIEFGADEKIENIAVGDSSTWQITPNRRGTIVFVKPTAAAHRTNMTVVTDKRTYLFDLVPGAKTAVPLYVLRFSHQAPVMAASAHADEAPAQVTAAPAQVAEGPRFQNVSWRAKGTKSLVPSIAYDDARSLFIGWPSAKPLPAVLTRVDRDQESPLNYSLSGQYIVVRPVPPNLVLRYGKDAAVLVPSALRATSATPTTSSGRFVIAASKSLPAAGNYNERLPHTAAALPTDRRIQVATSELLADRLAGADK